MENHRDTAWAVRQPWRSPFDDWEKHDPRLTDIFKGLNFSSKCQDGQVSQHPAAPIESLSLWDQQQDPMPAENRTSVVRFTVRDVIVLLTICGATTLSVFLLGSITVALPAIGKDLKFHENDLQWPITVYSLSYACLLLPCARISDTVGGRTVFIVGSSWFTIWSLVTAFAPNYTFFIVAMALKGVGSAANTPAALGLCSSYFPNKPGDRRRETGHAFLGAAQPIGFIFGIVLGGFLTDSLATWRSLFCVQTALSLIFTVTSYFVLPTAQERRYARGLDWGGAILSTAGLASLIYSLSESTTARRGWSSPQIPGLFSISVLTLVAFLYHERWRESENKSVLMPLTIWQQPGAMMQPLMAVVFFGWWSFNTLNYFFTLYYQQVERLNSLQTALRFIPMAVSGVIPNIAPKYLIGRVPPYIVIISGLLLNAVSAVLFALIDVHLNFWSMAFFMMITICGVDVIYPIGTLQIMSVFDKDSQSLAGGIFNVMTRVATSVGLAVTSSIASVVSRKYNSQHPELAPNSPEVLMVGFRVAGWTLFGAAMTSILIVALFLRKLEIRHEREPQTDTRDDVEAISMTSSKNHSGDPLKTDSTTSTVEPHTPSSA